MSGDLRKILEDYQERVAKIEDQKYDCEMAVMRKDFEINELNIQVNDLRGKFIKPTLKKVSKYENKFAKLQKKAAEFNFRNQLKTVKKKEFELEDESKKEGKPDWAAVVPGTKKGEGEAGEAEAYITGLAMVLASSYEEFEAGAENIYINSPLTTRCQFKYDHANALLSVKITDNVGNLEYRTDSHDDYKKLEKLIANLMTHMASSKEA